MTPRHRACSGRSAAPVPEPRVAECPTVPLMHVAPLLVSPAPTLFVPIGPAACGKTTLARALAAALAETGRALAVVSHEAVRTELFGRSDDLSDEPRVGARAQQLLEDALVAGHDAYADRTNLVAPFRTQSLAGARRACPETTCVALLRSRDLTLADLLARNRARARSDDDRGPVDPDVVASHMQAWRQTTLAGLFAWDRFAAVYRFDDDGVAALDPNGGLLVWT